MRLPAFRGCAEYGGDCRSVRKSEGACRVDKMRRGVENLRFALRGFRRDTFVHAMSILILILAVAIGANTAVFSIVNSALLRPLPFAESEQLVACN